MYAAYPWHFDRSGRTALVSEERHIRDLIEQVLFTSPGERVNRPNFGSGLLQTLFLPLADELAATAQFLVQGALQQWLGDLIEVEQVQVTHQDSTVHVLVVYTLRRTQQRIEAQFTRRT